MSKKLTKEIVNERIMDRGITLIDEYTNNSIKTEFQCKCGHKWATTPGHIMFGQGCPSCAGKLPLSKDIVNSRIMDRGIALIGEYINANTKTNFQCKCGHKWVATPGSIIAGGGCPLCAGSLPLSKEIVNSRIMGRGITLIGEYTNNYTKTEFQCKCGHKWEATPNSIMSSKGCSVCAHHGYNPGKPGWIYILIFNDYIKYGITNNLDQRLRQHKYNGEYTIAITKLYDDGNQALLWESNIKIIFGGRFVTKDICPDGYTETLCVSKLESLLKTVE